jgi:hypothetical protein
MRRAVYLAIAAAFLSSALSRPSSNTTYWGTGNPAPWVADNRPDQRQARYCL